MASSWPGNYDASFPGYPYLDNVEYVLGAYANSWVQAIQALQRGIGYGLGSVAANPLYSSVFSTSFPTITARTVNIESFFAQLVGAGTDVIPSIDTTDGDIQPVAVGGSPEAGNSGKAADAKHVHPLAVGPTLRVNVTNFSLTGPTVGTVFVDGVASEGGDNWSGSVYSFTQAGVWSVSAYLIVDTGSFTDPIQVSMAAPGMGIISKLVALLQNSDLGAQTSLGVNCRANEGDQFFVSYFNADSSSPVVNGYYSAVWLHN